MSNKASGLTIGKPPPIKYQNQKIKKKIKYQKSKIKKGRSRSRHVENMHTNFHANWSNSKASFPHRARSLQNPSMAKFAHFTRNSGHTGLSWFSIFWKTYRARNMIFWLKVDQICGNNRNKTAIQIFDFLPPKNFQNLIFLIFWKKLLHKFDGNFKKLYFDF